MLFSDGNTGGNYGIVWRMTDRSPIVRLGEGNALGWSPDERWALAQYFTPPQLVLYPMGPGELVRLKPGMITDFQTALWFPDGKSLLITGNEAGKPTRAYRQDVPGGEPKPLLEEGVIPAAISPDGLSILGVDTQKAWRWYPAGGGVPREAPGFTAEDRVAGIVGWSEDRKALLVRSGTDVPARIERVDVATGSRTLLKEIGSSDRTGMFMFDPYTVSRDGAQYAYRYWKRLSTLFVVSQ
ncbi:MAG: hypothetical protein ABIS06_02480 [Vicinamibacterales bacterium]